MPIDGQVGVNAGWCNIPAADIDTYKRILQLALAKPYSNRAMLCRAQLKLPGSEKNPSVMLEVLILDRTQKAMI